MKRYAVKVGEDFPLSVKIIRAKERLWRSRVSGVIALLAAVGLFGVFTGSAILGVADNDFTKLSTVWDYMGPLTAYLIGQSQDPRKGVNDDSS